MPRAKRSDPMPLKYWSSAGLILTYRCNARCASCYLSCGPDGADEMSIEDALRFWGQLIEASPHGSNIHLTGGEPFLDYPRLIELVRRAQEENLSPLKKIETNAFWASDETTVRDRVAALGSAGMQKLCVSADPYHQQFVPIEFARALARITEEILGRDRLQVRWEDWLKDGFDTDKLAPAQRSALFARYATGGRDRMNGRAGNLLAPQLQHKPVEEFADSDCRGSRRRSRHVHIDGHGRVIPGTCTGIVIGVVGASSVAELWSQLDADRSNRAILTLLCERGPIGLLPEAMESGYAPKDGYASRCHLCWELRRHFVLKGLHTDELWPLRLYEPNCSSAEQTACDRKRTIT